MSNALTMFGRIFSSFTVASLFFYGAFDRAWWVYSADDPMRMIILAALHIAGLVALSAWLEGDPGEQKRRTK